MKREKRYNCAPEAAVGYVCMCVCRQGSGLEFGIDIHMGGWVDEREMAWFG